MKRIWKTPALKISICAVCAAVVLGITACSEWNPAGGGEGSSDLSMIETVWVYSPKNNLADTKGMIYEPSINGLKPLEHGGFQLKSNGEYISFASVGFCGTPPVIYGEYKGGSWNMLANNRLAVKATYWQQGQFLYDTLEVVSHSSNQLVLRSIRQ